MINQQNSGIGKSAERLLNRLVTADAVTEEGPVSAGSNTKQFADAEILVSNDLAIRRANGSLEITDAGRSHVARQEIARSGSEIDPFVAQHLELEERELQTASGRARVNINTA